MKPFEREPQLTEAFIRSVRPDPTKTARAYSDTPTLWLKVSRWGRKTWLQRIVIHGKQTDLLLGSWPLIPAVEARHYARRNRALARSGQDPTAGFQHLPYLTVMERGLLDQWQPASVPVGRADSGQASLPF